MSKTDPGRFFEDFRLGQVIVRGVAWTITWPSLKSSK